VARRRGCPDWLRAAYLARRPTLHAFPQRRCGSGFGALGTAVAAAVVAHNLLHLLADGSPRPSRAPYNPLFQPTLSQPGR
jgi:hypothetical protein